jgi:hypothetical protein
MSRIAKIFPSNHLAALLAMWPRPWYVARRRNLPITATECVDIRDANDQRVVEVHSSTLADGIVEAINGAFLLGHDEPPPELLQIEPWRGQEAEEAKL